MFYYEFMFIRSFLFIDFYTITFFILDLKLNFCIDIVILNVKVLEEVNLSAMFGSPRY